MYTNKVLELKNKQDPTNVEIHEALGNHYNTLAEQITGVADNNWHLVINGPTGAGKTEFVRSILAHNSKGKTTLNSGTLSAVMLFKLLYQNRAEHDVLVIDDTDSIFENTESVEVLKGALDSQGEKSVEWSKYSNVLAQDGIPTSFTFRGRIIIITNRKIQRDPQAVRNNKDRALLPLWSRVMYFAAGLPNRDWEVESINMYAQQGLIKCFEEKNISVTGQNDIIQFISDYKEELLDVNFRTVSQIADFYNAFDNNRWQDHAISSLT